MSFDAFLRLAASVLGVAGLAGMATTGLLSARRRETGRILTDLVDAQGLDLERLKGREGECQRRLAGLQAEVASLKELVTQAAAVARLTERVDIHHEVVLRRLDELTAAAPRGLDG